MLPLSLGFGVGDGEGIFGFQIQALIPPAISGFQGWHMSGALCNSRPLFRATVAFLSILAVPLMNDNIEPRLAG